MRCWRTWRGFSRITRALCSSSFPQMTNEFIKIHDLSRAVRGMTQAFSTTSAATVVLVV